MQVRLLGPVDVVVNGEARPVSGLRRQAVLAVLALQCGEVVSISQLMEAVWGGAAPVNAINALQNHVSYLRRLLGTKTPILNRPPGYVLDLPGDGTDIRMAERLLRQGAKSADAVPDLQAALALWRGEPLAELADLPWRPAQVERLESLRLQLRQALLEARLAAGEHTRLIPEFEQLITDRPRDEWVHGQLMLALYRSGRQADALAVYHKLRQALDDDLGIEPSQFLRDLQASILSQDPALNLAPPARTPGAELPVPAQLPSALASLTGRDVELARLDSIAEGVTQDGAILVALSGTAGVGKTALATYWAHRVSARFPGGHLYVNLRGFDPAGAALDPGQALHGFLEALGVPAARIPEDLDARSALFRSVVAGQRVLLVLDNARDADQVRPLLPGSPDCLTLVTSRDQLAGLVAAAGAIPLALDLLSPADARQLLTRRLGAGPVAAESAAVEAIIDGCAGLPLALAIAAARAAARPGFPLAAIAAELAEATSALDPFEGGDRVTDVRAVLSWSYRALDDSGARMFRLLGLHLGPDIGAAAAASLAAVPIGAARAQLAQLTRAHLLTEHAPGRYAFHDLLRAYAAELARDHDDQAAQQLAVDRVLDHYLHSGHSAAMLMEPLNSPVILTAPSAKTVIDRPATSEEALAWYAAERSTLMAAVELSAQTGPSTRTWQLVWTLSVYLLLRGLGNDQAQACKVGLRAARRDGDQVGEAYCLQRLGVGYAKSGRIASSKAVLTDALRLFELLGNYLSQAVTHRTLFWIADRQGAPAQMLVHAERCYELFAAGDNAIGQAMALQSIGFAQAQLGNYDLAIAQCERALVALRELGQRGRQGGVWDSLGYIHHQRGEYEQAISCYQNAAGCAREMGDRFNEADTIHTIGNVHRSAGRLGAARQAWTQALAIFDEIDHPDADLVRAKLQALARI